MKPENVLELMRPGVISFKEPIEKIFVGITFPPFHTITLHEDGQNVDVQYKDNETGEWMGFFYNKNDEKKNLWWPESDEQKMFIIKREVRLSPRSRCGVAPSECRYI